MGEFFNQFTVSDWVQFYGIISSCVLSFAAILIAILTLTQNNKMIRENTRPYILMSYETINTGSNNCFFMLKNYGASGAKIIDFSCLADFNDEKLTEQFSKIKSTYLAPNQRKFYYFKAQSFTNNEVKFYIKYKCANRIYKEQIDVQIKLGNLSLRNEEDIAIPSSLQEIVERMI